MGADNRTNLAAAGSNGRDGDLHVSLDAAASRTVPLDPDALPVLEHDLWWTPSDSETFLSGYAVLGSRWAELARVFPWATPLGVRLHWYRKMEPLIASGALTLAVENSDEAFATLERAAASWGLILNTNRGAHFDWDEDECSLLAAARLLQSTIVPEGFALLFPGRTVGEVRNKVLPPMAEQITMATAKRLLSLAERDLGFTVWHPIREPEITMGTSTSAFNRIEIKSVLSGNGNVKL